MLFMSQSLVRVISVFGVHCYCLTDFFARELMTQWIAQLMDPVHAGGLRHDHNLTNTYVRNLRQPLPVTINILTVAYPTSQFVTIKRMCVTYVHFCVAI